MLDRTLAPPSGEITFDGIPEINKLVLPSGAVLNWLSAGEQPVVKIEIVFQSGIWYEKKKAVSWLAAKMLTEGTRTKSAKDVISGFENLGAFLEISPGFDDISIAVYGLKRNFGQVIDLINEIFNESTYPQHEFDLLKSSRKDQITLNNNKNNLLASKKLREAIYGPEYPYGQGLDPIDIDAVELSDVTSYYKDGLFNNPEIYICGSLDDALIDDIVSRIQLPVSKDSVVESQTFSSKQRHIFVSKEKSLQSSLRMAWLIPDRKDKDYFNYLIANSLLGGYFGSRLMKNIREDKGYTYGIHAYPVHLKNSSFGLISTDVKAEHTNDTISEITLEIGRLLNEPILDEEIMTLTNYLSGSFLASINTPFQLMAKFKKVNEAGLDLSYYQQYFDSLKATSQAQIKEAIERYFKPENAYSSIVGLNQ